MRSEQRRTRRVLYVDLVGRPEISEFIITREVGCELCVNLESLSVEQCHVERNSVRIILAAATFEYLEVA